jgi:hypothetical protein
VSLNTVMVENSIVVPKFRSFSMQFLVTASVVPENKLG